MEVVATEFENLKDLINASRNVSGVVVAYRFGEIRVFKGIAYIVTSLGRNYWYVLYTRNFDISSEAEALEFTSSGEIREISLEDMGRDPKAIYFTVIRPIRDEIVEPILSKLNK